jgi:hypothetical protein
MKHLDLSFIRTSAASILKSSPVDYLKTAQLRGCLFEDSDPSSGLVSSADTKFYVDHEEPLEALQIYQADRGEWPLGKLLEGHEYLAIVERRV